MQGQSQFGCLFQQHAHVSVFELKNISFLKDTIELKRTAINGSLKQHFVPIHLGDLLVHVPDASQVEVSCPIIIYPLLQENFTDSPK